MTSFDLGETVRIRRKKDLLCMYNFRKSSYQWMTDYCGRISMVESIGESFASRDEAIAYSIVSGFHQTFGLKDFHGIEFFPQELELL